MYEKYTRQSLPSKEYRELLGSAICVFNSNNVFVIENILKEDSKNYSWYDLIDKESGKLMNPIKNTITKASDTQIACLFDKIICKRNRIIHSFQITDSDGEQRLATKDREDVQFIITEDYLIKFIKENEKLCDMLHLFREYQQGQRTQSSIGS